MNHVRIPFHYPVTHLSCLGRSFDPSLQAIPQRRHMASKACRTLLQRDHAAEGAGLSAQRLLVLTLWTTRRQTESVRTVEATATRLVQATRGASHLLLLPRLPALGVCVTRRMETTTVVTKLC